MTKPYKTEQEAFGAGQFGDDYIGRNNSDNLIASNEALFKKILVSCVDSNSLIEFGANIGMNIRAIHNLNPAMQLDAIEINENAVGQLKNLAGIRNVYHDSSLNFPISAVADIALIKGVLIHIDPGSLHDVYQSLFRTSRKYIVLAEYYNPTPVELDYRGYQGRLFKRDFAGELLELFPSVKIVDYGLVWHRDPNSPLDDVIWFVFKKGD